MSYQSTLLQHLFDQPDIKAIPDDRFAKLAGEYPYFAHARWFKALKEAELGHGSDSKAAAEAAVYTFLPLRLMQFLSPEVPEKGIPIEAGKPAVEAEANESPLSGEPLSANGQATGKAEAEATSQVENSPDGNYAQAPLIQPLFTSDYFAFTGQELPEQIENDKRPTMEQLHSFTGWLRTLKRAQGTTDPDLKEDEASMAARAESEDAGIKKSAEASLKADEEVLTEAMAEVRVSKGQVDKAIDIYRKLSLSNPEKSAYFAQKIADLKK